MCRQPSSEPTQKYPESPCASNLTPLKKSLNVDKTVKISSSGRGGGEENGVDIYDYPRGPWLMKTVRKDTQAPNRHPSVSASTMSVPAKGESSGGTSGGPSIMLAEATCPLLRPKAATKNNGKKSFSNATGSWVPLTLHRRKSGKKRILPTAGIQILVDLNIGRAPADTRPQKSHRAYNKNWNGTNKSL